MQEIGIFSRNLYNYRAQAKLTQREVAAKIGVRQQTVAAWEANRSTPSPDVLCELARMFNITTDELLLYSLPEDEFWPKRRVMVPIVPFEHIQEVQAHVTPQTQHIFMEGEYGKEYVYTAMPDESMLPYIFPNDQILLTLTSKIEHNEIAVLANKEKALVRKVAYEKNSMILVPLANAYPIIYVPEIKDSDWKIIGKVESTKREW